jgi:rhodanese-related sulfurtransferase/DNA-binding transcriptional ArsR family regulator
MSRRAKQALYAQLGRIGKGVSSGPRLEILDLLSQSPRTVDSIASAVEQSVANTSRHLQVLRRAGLVDAEREGVHVRYRIADDKVADFVRSLRVLAEERLLEMVPLLRELRADHGPIEAIDRERLVELVKSGEAQALDVRPAEEYASSHIDGALSIPLAELEQRMGELPRDRVIVAYCRGPFCVMAPEAVQLLRERGYQAHCLDEGVTDWRARGGELAQ